MWAVGAVLRAPREDLAGPAAELHLLDRKRREISMIWSFKASRKFRPPPVLLSRPNVSLGATPSLHTPPAGGTVPPCCHNAPCAAGESHGQHCWWDLARSLASMAALETDGRPRLSLWWPPGPAEPLEQDLPCCKSHAHAALRVMHVPKSGYCQHVVSPVKLFHTVTPFTAVILVIAHADQPAKCTRVLLADFARRI